jgi:hypothetical protein
MRSVDSERIGRAIEPRKLLVGADVFLTAEGHADALYRPGAKVPPGS